MEARVCEIARCRRVAGAEDGGGNGDGGFGRSLISSSSLESVWMIFRVSSDSDGCLDVRGRALSAIFREPESSQTFR